MTRDLVGYRGDPPNVRWPDGHLVCLSVVLNVEEGSEDSFDDGDGSGPGLVELGRGDLARPVTYQPDLHGTSAYDFGPRVGFWRLMRLVDEFEIPITFMCSGQAVERSPALAPALRDPRHEVCGHGWRWGGAPPWQVPEDVERELIVRTRTVLADLTGRPIQGWYSRYAPSTRTRRLLRELGFAYDSDSYADDLPYYVPVDGEPFLVVPYSMVTNDYRLVRGTGVGGLAGFVDELRRTFRAARREAEAGRPTVISLGLHSRVSGHLGRLEAVREILADAVEAGDVWFATRAEIAAHWREAAPPMVRQ
jgi:allantoinase